MMSGRTSGYMALPSVRNGAVQSVKNCEMLRRKKWAGLPQYIYEAGVMFTLAFYKTGRISRVTILKTGHFTMKYV